MQSEKNIVDKIKKEQKDLSNNLQKLELFIRTSNDFKKLDPALKSLLLKQYKSMHDYFDQLEQRRQYLNGHMASYTVDNLRNIYDDLYKSMFGKR